MYAWKKNFENNYSDIIDIFYGQLHTETECVECEYISHIFDIFSSLSLEIPKSQEHIKIEDCLSKFTEEEIITDDINKWFCPQCEYKVAFKKRVKIWKTPHILIIHLKRFSYNDSTLSKINDLIKFPEKNISIKPFISKYNKNSDNQFKLYSVINHQGSYNEGHYYSTNLNLNNKWYIYNDSRVSDLNSDLITNNAYILFYQKESY